jgi:hypothetical protein
MYVFTDVAELRLLKIARVTQRSLSQFLCGALNQNRTDDLILTMEEIASF